MKRPMPSEISIREIARKSLVMKKNLPAGTILEKDHLIAKRPGQGIPPSKLLSVVGHVLKTSKKADALIQWEDID